MALQIFCYLALFNLTLAGAYLYLISYILVYTEVFFVARVEIY